MKKCYLTAQQVEDAKAAGVLQWISKDEQGYYAIQQTTPGESVALACMQNLEIAKRRQQADEQEQRRARLWGSLERMRENRFDHRQFFEGHWNQ